MSKKKLDSKELLFQKKLDKDKETSRAYHKFRQSIRTTSTLKAYNGELDKFMILSRLDSYDKAVGLKADDVQDH